MQSKTQNYCAVNQTGCNYFNKNYSINMQLEEVITHVVGMQNKKAQSRPQAYESNNDAVCLGVITETCRGFYHNKIVNMLFLTQCARCATWRQFMQWVGML